ncbi:DMT family transporter [Ruegeria sp. EL01]|uniref:DMT family transporter n=1 Tax=Ruegeria sp. EL01 TaxID=2107578 RepID=UPI000EA80DCE|nr:DMT family transporter [Ruegeria sp. EL01]
MFETLLIVGIGLAGGFAVGAQAQIAGSMGNRIGGAAGSFIVHLGGAVASLALLIARGGENISEWRHLPWYMLGSGIFGLILYLTLSQTVPKLGATSAIALVVVGQLLVGLLIEHFGLFDASVRSINLSRIAAAILLLAGAYLMLR